MPPRSVTFVQVVFAGGYPYTSETWVLDLDTFPAPTWAPGPELPSPPAYRGASVQHSSGGFLAVGGELESGEASAEVLLYDPDVEEWTGVAGQQLGVPRSGHAAVIITEDYLDCQ